MEFLAPFSRGRDLNRAERWKLACNPLRFFRAVSDTCAPAGDQAPAALASLESKRNDCKGLASDHVEHEPAVLVNDHQVWNMTRSAVPFWPTMRRSAVPPICFVRSATTSASTRTAAGPRDTGADPMSGTLEGLHRRVASSARRANDSGPTRPHLARGSIDTHAGHDEGCGHYALNGPTR